MVKVFHVALAGWFAIHQNRHPSGGIIEILESELLAGTPGDGH